MLLGVVRTTGSAPENDVYVLVAGGFDDGGKSSLTDSKEN